jgi:dienelactone hydrolase
MRGVLAFFFIATLAMSTSAKMVTKSVEYDFGGSTYEGYVAYDDGISGQRPGVLVIHEWWGVNDYVKHRCEQLAALGYVAFAPDIYGKGKRASTMDEARALVMPLYGDVPTLRARATAGLEELKKQPLCDANKIAVMGYCFGGKTALELARSGAPMLGVVSFHGGLATPNPEDAKKIHGKVLVLHGADDPNVKPEEVAAFETEMRNAGVDWQLVKYGGAVHAFTNPAAGNDPSKGMAYNERADKRSWEAMRQFFAEIFK